ncbi:kinesin-like protein KIF26A [Pholidichthys leucotaenia]
MYRQDWDRVQAPGPDYRRFTVVEGDCPLPLGSTCCRKRLRSVGEDDDDGSEETARRRSFSFRPNPEGSLSANELSCYGREEEEDEGEELRRLCQRCFIMASQLNRQAAAVADPAALKEPAYASFLFNKLQRLQLPHRGRYACSDTHCDVCGVAFQQLRRLALRRALGVGREMTPRPAAPNTIPDVTPNIAPNTAANAIPAYDGDWVGGELLVKQQRRMQEEEQQQGRRAPCGWGGVQSCYLGGGGVKGLATVTPLPLNPQDYLEGVWRVSCCRPEARTGLTSDGGHMTSDDPVNLPYHSIGTQPSRPPSATAAFFIRVAQKLSVTLRRRSQPGPPSPPSEGPGPLWYTGGFSGALQLAPPPIPPCLLRAGSKVKDTPGLGKVRVMVRVCSALSDESSESASFLKVDSRKKQINLYQTSEQKRSSAPKTFAFDAIFTQDSSQAEVCSGTVAEVIQSVMNGADGCIFCYGHANLGKTYTMIGRDCSTQSLGVAPTAISWLFKVIEERRQKSGTRFSIQVSAVEISGREEMLTDLLVDFSSTGGQSEAPGPGVSLREDPLCGYQLQNQTELRVASAERAAAFLDAALTARSCSRMPNDLEARRNSHFLFTLHLHQERAEKTSKTAMNVRSRLHLLDLGSCETDISRTREGGGAKCLSLSALGNVILALANGAKHVPYRDSKLTMLLRESLGNINCRTTMIAHVSDSPLSYMETLTTLQLAARVHHVRKKKAKYTSSSSGGESSCEEGPSHRPPHLRPFHPRIVALDPETPLLLSSDPDYSSSGEHSCDTVIYVGPGEMAISDRELSDNEGPPSFIPIIPSLNKKRVKDTPRSDGDHFKCSTFAELQERLDCIDSSEGSTTFVTEAKTAALRTQAGDTRLTEDSSPSTETNSSQTILKNAPTLIPDQEQFRFSLKRMSADGAKLADTPFQPYSVKPDSILCQKSEPVVCEKFFHTRAAPRPSPSLSLLNTSRTASEHEEVLSRTPAVGTSQQGHLQASPDVDRAAHSSRYPMEVNSLRASLLNQDFFRTTVTLQQPVELNGEDELVFTFIEELPHGLIPDNGRPSNLLSFNRGLVVGSRPVSIISSINDEYDAYMTQQGVMEDVGVDGQERSLLQNEKTPPISDSHSGHSIESEGVHSTGTLHLRDKSLVSQNASLLTSPSIFHKQPFLQHGIKSSLNDSGVCFSELDSDPAMPNKVPFTKCSLSPESTKASPKGSPKVRASILNTAVSVQGSHHGAHSSLPRKTKLTSTAAVGCSRQEGRQDEFLLQGSSQFDPREVEFLSAGKPPGSGIMNISSKRSGGNSNSIPRSPKAQMSSSAQRVIDGCEKSNSRKGDNLMKLPKLTRGATTLGAISTPQSSDSKLAHEAASVTGMHRFSSLGKKVNGQKTSVICKSRSENIPLPTTFVRQSSQEQKARTVPSPSALKTCSNTGKSFFPKLSTSEEEFNIRQQADSFSHRTSSLKTEHSSPRTTSSLKTRGAKADPSRHFGSLMSLERCASPTIAGSKPEQFSGAASEGKTKSDRSVPKLGVPASTSTSHAPVSPGFFSATSKLGLVRAGSSSRPSTSAGMKVRTLSTGSSRTVSFTSKPHDNTNGRNTSLPPTGKSPSHSETGIKTGRGTIMGTKQAISRASNNRVSELAVGGQRKLLGGGARSMGSNGTDNGTSCISTSPLSTLLPSPYSKITAPRRPQRYSSGHGSDNSSILSGELPPAMGRTALFYHSGGSSGYESMIRDSETTGSTSSAHDSMSESGPTSSSRGRVSKSPKKRGNGFLRRRLIPAPLPDPSSPGRKVGGQWADVKENFEIKVYEIDDMERVQRSEHSPVPGLGHWAIEEPAGLEDQVRASQLRTGQGEGVASNLKPAQGILYFSARLRMLERRQQKIRELQVKQEQLKEELWEARRRLVQEPGRWRTDVDVDHDLDADSQEYLEVLAQTTAELELCINLCKSCLMMETCFDITMTTTTTSGSTSP